MDREGPASRADWKVLDLPSAVAELTLDFDLSADDLARVSRGHIPESMDDKWFIYREGDRLLFHRSWGGICVYSAAIEENQSSSRIGRVAVNRDPAQYRSTDDQYDAMLLRFLIEAILLQRDVPFPRRSDAGSREHPGLYQHVVAGTGRPELVVPRESWWRRLLSWRPGR